jgi:hypothetical protein
MIRPENPAPAPCAARVAHVAHANDRTPPALAPAWREKIIRRLARGRVRRRWRFRSWTDAPPGALEEYSAFLHGRTGGGRQRG